MLRSIRVCIGTVWETGRIPSQRDGPLPAEAVAGPVYRVVGPYSRPPSFCSTWSARIPKEAQSQTNPRLSVYEFPEFISVLPSKGSVMFPKKVNTDLQMQEVNDRTLALKFKNCSNILWNLTKKQTVNLSHTKISCMHSQGLINLWGKFPGESTWGGVTELYIYFLLLI